LQKFVSKKQKFDEASKYIKKIKENHTKALLFARIDQWEAAIGVAESTKSERVMILEDLKRKCRTQKYIEMIDDLLNSVN